MNATTQGTHRYRPGTELARLTLDYIDVLTWPSVVIVALVLFRRSLRGAFARLSAFEGFGVKASLDQAVADNARVVSDSGGRSAISRRESHLPAGVDRNQIVSLWPSSYAEVRQVGEAYRDGMAPVLVNLDAMDDEEAKRCVDFMAGMIFLERGTIERITNRVFVLYRADPSPR